MYGHQGGKVAGRGGSVGMNLEIGIDIYTLICIKWITNKKLLYKKIKIIYIYSSVGRSCSSEQADTSHGTLEASTSNKVTFPIKEPLHSHRRCFLLTSFC